MKIILQLLTVVFLVFLLSCTVKDCPDCFTPPEAFILELVDKTTGDNLFAIDSLDSEEIEVIDLVDDSSVEFTFLDENEINWIQIHTIGWQTEIVNYSIWVDETEICILHVDAERVDGDCCDHTEYHEIEISNAEFSQDSTTGIYKILLDL